MGYLIRIGQAHFKQTDPECPPDWCVDEIQIPQAPANEAPYLNHWNKWMPSYTSWSHFCDRFDLPMDFDPPECYGYTILQPEHYALFHGLLERYRTQGREEANFEFHMQRLIWLDWWIGWALQNCPNPIITFR